jgi:serine/threonine-protein kinase
MATIHRAFDQRLDRPVAVKLLHPEVTKDADLADRVRREALAATVLRHPNIVACLDTGTDGDQPYLVMDLVDGEDLAARLKRGGRLPPAQVARIGLDVARALGAAHLRGIVHRDVKPGNILLAADGRALVTDFGIARLAADAEAARPGTTLGSVHYFSPEQARGSGTTPASDVYGLGLTLYEALTGARPFGGSTTEAVALARIGAPAPSPRALRPDVPAGLDAVIVRALAPEPTDRYPNGNLMAAALEPIIGAADPGDATSVVVLPRNPQAAEEPVAGAAPVAAAAPGSGPVPRQKRAGRSRHPRPPARPDAARSRTAPPGVLVALLALLGVVGGALLVAAIPGQGSGLGPSASDVAIVASPTATPTPRPSPTPRPTATPTPSPPPSRPPTAVPAGEVADLCDIFFDIPCGLGPGRYAPSRFQPPFDIELGDGWSNAAHTEDIVALTRAEGTMTFAGAITQVDPSGRATKPKARARDIVEAFIATDRVGASRPSDVRIGGRRGLSVDLSPTDGKRVDLFATATSVFHLEPDRTTRVVVVDLKGGRTALIAIEPGDGSELREILVTADPAAGTIHWR